MTLTYEYRISPVGVGDGVDIERRVIGEVSGKVLTYRHDALWVPYCRVNTNATQSTYDESHHLVDLLNREEEEFRSPFCSSVS